MTGTLVTFRKELLSYCYSPVSYLIAVLFYLWHGFLVTEGALKFVEGQADRDLFPTYCYGLPSTFFMVLLVPGILTMRCFAEERRSGSIEVLMTAPVRDLGVVLGKWLAAVVFYLLLWLPTVLLLWVLTFGPFLGVELAFGPVFAAYLGMFLLSALLLAFGCFASSLTDNLLLAAIVAILFNFALLQLPGYLRGHLGNPDASPHLATLLEKLDVNSNFQQWFARGLIDTSQVWVYVGGTAFFLFLTVLSFSARRVEGIRLRALGSWLHLVVAGALMLCVWVLLVWVGARPALRSLIDMTPGRRASVDPVTEELLHGLAGAGVKVEFHAFFLPTGAPPTDADQVQVLRIVERLHEQTRMLLRQYAYLGGDAVKVYVHDQNTDAATIRAAAQRFGVTGPDWVVVAVQQGGKEPRYRRLSLEADLAVIDVPQLQQGSTPVPRSSAPILRDYRGEQALSSALKGLLVQGTPTVYVLNGNSLDISWHPTVGAGYGQLHKALIDSGFDVKEVTTFTGAVPKDASIVVALEPRREFADTEVKALLDYLRRGGRLFVDYSWSAQPSWNPDGGELGRQLGYQVGAQRIFHLIPAEVPPGIDGNPRVGKLDLVVNQQHPITQRLGLHNRLLQFDMARELIPRTDAPAGIRREELLSTGPYAWLAVPNPAGGFDYTRPQVGGAMRPFTLGMVTEVDGTVADEHGNKPTGIAVIMSGLFCNNVGMPVNGDLVLNTCNWLSDRRVLLDIRGSHWVSPSLELTLQQQDHLKWLLELAVPLLFLLLGLLVFVVRRRL